MSIPPGLFYAIGALLVVFGVLRLYHFGVRRPRRDMTDDEGGNVSARARQRRQHLIGGSLWVILGAFLMLSTAGVIRLPF